MGEPLYQITERYREFQDLIAADPDLDEQAIQDTLEGIEGELVAKCASVAAMIMNLEASAKARKEAAKRITARAKTEQNRADWLRGYLLEQMQATNQQKISTDEFVVKVEDNPGRVSDDIDMDRLPVGLVITTVTKTPNKTEIRKMLLDGKDLGGAARLIKDQRVVIK
jgi:hypothetical protein